MSPTLYVRNEDVAPPTVPGADAYRRASLADLVEVLKQEGAYEVDVEHKMLTADGKEFRVIRPIVVNEPGRYLILPLGDTP